MTIESNNNRTILTWDTTFNTASNLMIHTFTGGIQVITDINTGKSRIMKGDQVIADGETISVGTYEKRLIKIAHEAEKLKAFRQ